MAAQIDTHKLSRQIAGQVERGDWKAIEDHFNEPPFVRPVKQIGVYVVAEVTREIGRKLFVESTLFDGEDEPCCYASGEIRTGIK